MAETRDGVPEEPAGAGPAAGRPYVEQRQADMLQIVPGVLLVGGALAALVTSLRPPMDEWGTWPQMMWAFVGPPWIVFLAWAGLVGAWLVARGARRRSDRWAAACRGLGMALVWSLLAAPLLALGWSLVHWN